MRRLVVPVALLLLTACSMPPRQDTPASSGQVQHVTLLVGMREFDDDDVDTLGVESQVAAGVEYDTYDAQTGNGFEVGYSQSTDESSFAGFDIELEVQEVYLGYRHTFMPERNLHPYLGLGVTYVHGEMDAGFTSADDHDLGPYVHGGVAWDLGERLRLGLDYRMVFAEFDGVDGDYSQLALMLGFGF